LTHLPEKRLRDVAQMAVQGILAARSPVLTEAASWMTRSSSPGWTARIWMSKICARGL
jgi:hypothetical protein